jgi:predicted DNA-binding protein with PD1-like motif
MNAKVLRDEPGGRTFALVFDPGDEPLSGLERFAAESGLEAAHFTAIGAFRSATLGFFDRDTKDYLRNEVGEQTEVLSLAGNVALHEGRPRVHAHVVLGKRDGTAHGGHLLGAEVWPTLEVILTEAPSHLRRRHDPRTGLPLIRV